MLLFYLEVRVTLRSYWRQVFTERIKDHLLGGLSFRQFGQIPSPDFPIKNSITTQCQGVKSTHMIASAKRQFASSRHSYRLQQWFINNCIVTLHIGCMYFRLSLYLLVFSIHVLQRNNSAYQCKIRHLRFVQELEIQTT